MSSENRLMLDDRLRHIAIIMDGNGRWATGRGLPREAGHKSGAAALRRIVEYCEKIGLASLTVYAFSTENWKRPKREVDAIISLLKQYVAECERDYQKSDYKITYSVHRVKQRAARYPDKRFLKIKAKENCLCRCVKYSKKEAVKRTDNGIHYIA